MPDQKFKLSSLRGDAAFRRVLSQGEAMRSPHFLIKRLPYKPKHGEPWSPRVVAGIVASKKKLGKAVCRNRARRRVKEALRQIECLPCRVVIILDSGVLKMDFGELMHALEQSLNRPLKRKK
ncbi:MAG: ribonuclease P protein component [Deinococcaceae bacterium]